MSADFLEQVTAHKRAEIEAARQLHSEQRLRAAAEKRSDQRPFIRQFEDAAAGEVHIIAEVKRASPSRGDIRADLAAEKLAAAYERGGAAAVSVLTETRWFKGSLADLQAARQATGLPVLRKDFIIDAYQIVEAAAAGADAVLLIAALLSFEELLSHLERCGELGIEALVEVHTPEDIAIVNDTPARLIGINNRNLRSLETSTSVAADMAGRLSPDKIPVAASGIRSRADIEAAGAAGIHSFLIGEHLVRAEDPAGFLRELKGTEGLRE
jgi:indole-3-glycerol phosphate synthase